MRNAVREVLADDKPRRPAAVANLLKDTFFEGLLDQDAYPTTPCVEGEPCGCGSSRHIGPEDCLNLRQRPLYGTRKWKESYGRRSAVEAANACLKVHHARLQRSSTRVRGTERNGILLAFIVAAVNTAILLSRYGYDVGQPQEGRKDGPILPLPQQRETFALHRSKRPFVRPTVKAPPPPGKPSQPTSWSAGLVAPQKTLHRKK